MSDQAVDGPLADRAPPLPSPPIEPVSGEDHARVAGEGGEEVELPGSELEATVVDGRLTTTRVDPEAAHLDRAAAP